MRGLVALLALLAALKVGGQQYLVSTTKSEIIVSTYRQRAAGACERASKLQQIGNAQDWAKTEDVRLVIGKGALDVQIWQLDHALWRARFKNPYLILSAPEKTKSVFCEFDIVQDVASVFRL